MSLFQVAFTGARNSVRDMVKEYDFPGCLGERESLIPFIVSQVPNGDTWTGTFRVSGYRTDADATGKGTVYVSCSWTPAHQEH